MINRLIRYKVYIDRSRSYVGIIQFLIVILIGFGTYKETDFGIWVYKYSYITIPTLIIIVLGLMIIWGYVDMKYIRPKEYSELNKTNRELMEIHKIIVGDDLQNSKTK